MGGKLLWQIFSNKKLLVSQILWKNYIHGGTLRNIQMTNTPKCSITWNLCRRGLEYFTQHLYRISGNGRQTFLWDDKIKGNTPLNTDVFINDIKLWLVNKGLLSLSDIISWDRKGNQDAWSFPKLPDRDHPILLAQQKSLLEKLSGLTPIHLSCKDKWG